MPETPSNPTPTGFSFNKADQTRFVTASVRDIGYDSKLLRKFRQNPDIVLDEMVKSKNIPEDKQDIVKEKIKQGVIETDQVLPGLNCDEAKNMLYASLETPRVSFEIFTWLNVALFIVGILFFVLAAVMGLALQKEQFSIVFGVGGLASILPLFITNPLKRISNAASDQSQLRTVIFGYWSQLSNLRTQMLRSKQEPDFQMVQDINAELQKIMAHAVVLLQEYVEAKVQDKSSEIDAATDAAEAPKKSSGK